MAPMGESRVLVAAESHARDTSINCTCVSLSTEKFSAGDDN